MKDLLILLILCVGCLTAADAQTFTQRLQKSRQGEGRITLSESMAIDELVNGPKTESAAQPSGAAARSDGQPAPKTQADSRTDAAARPAQVKPDSSRLDVRARLAQLPDTASDSGRKKVIKGGYKVNGYRVQVYAGGNTRDAQNQARRVGREINALFPGTPVYVHFISPRWICRMGNYRTYEEASEVLRSVRKLGYNSSIIVKGKITVTAPPATAPVSEP